MMPEKAVGPGAPLGLGILGRHQPRIVPQRFEPAAQVMGADTGFHADEAGRQVGELGFELCARQLQAQNDGAALVETDEVEGGLADVDAENGDGIFGMARHGGLLAPGHPPTRGYCGEHRRSIPL